MPKPTRALMQLPPATAAAIERLGADLAVARLRRKESLRTWAVRMGVSVPTLQRLEAGDPGVGIGMAALETADAAALVAEKGKGVVDGIQSAMKPITAIQSQVAEVKDAVDTATASVNDAASEATASAATASAATDKSAATINDATNAPAKNLCKLLGKHDGADLFLRTGRYGPYLTWGDQKQSLPAQFKLGGAHNENVDEIQITYDEAVRYANSDTLSANSNAPNANGSGATLITSGTSILREINAHTSVRSGKFGAYIYYKNPKMKTPAFVSLREFKGDWKTCDTQVLEMWATTTPVKKK